MLNVQENFCKQFATTLLIGFTATLLIGCGGSGTTSPGGNNGLISSLPSGNSGLASGNSGVITYVTEKSYASGTGVISGSGQDGNASANYTAAHLDIDSVTSSLSGDANLEYLSYGEDALGYEAEEGGITSSGKTVYIDYAGYFITNGTEEHASAGEITIDGVDGVFTAGSKVNGLPTGSFGYAGAVAFYKNGATVDFEQGSFSMTANFSNQTGSISANTNSYSFGETNIAINSSDGSFSGSSGTIGTTGGATDTSNLKGFFAGTNANGVHGMAYSAGSEANYVATFAGKKQ